jgi:hypothetical protein
MIDVRIQGIEAKIKVTFWVPPLPAITRADPHKCCEEEPAEIEYEVFDRRGRPAPWLAQKITDADHVRIVETFLASRENVYD